jgi:hypothetical protein
MLLLLFKNKNLLYLNNYFFSYLNLFSGVFSGVFIVAVFYILASVVGRLLRVH